MIYESILHAKLTMTYFSDGPSELYKWLTHKLDLRREWLLAVFRKIAFWVVAVTEALQGSAQKCQIASEIHTVRCHVRLFGVVDKDRCVRSTLWAVWKGTVLDACVELGKYFEDSLRSMHVCVQHMIYEDTPHALTTGLKLVNSKATSSQH